MYCIYILPSLPHKNHPTDLEIEPMKHSEAGASASNAPMPWYCTSALPSYWVSQAFIGNFLRPTTNVVFFIFVSSLMFHLLKFKDLSLYIYASSSGNTQNKKKRRAQTPQNFTFPHQGAAPKAQSMSPPLILRFTWTSMPPKRNCSPGTSNQPGNNCSVGTLCFHPIPGRYFFLGGTHSGKLLISPHLPDMSKPYDHCLHQRLSLPTRTPA